jgi:putative Mg2+ transporter-C (MgtC) family protein
MPSQLELLAMVALSMLLGAAVGWEREAARKPAGLRTHMLVAGAAAMLTGLSELLVNDLSIPDPLISADPIRVVQAVVTGVTFLGAGTIIRQREDAKGDVKGLTTAASLLFVAALGIGVALGQYLLAVGGALLVLAVVGGLSIAEEKLRSGPSSH